MKKYRRILLWAAGGLGVILIALLFTLTVVAPRVISSGSTKARIRDEFAKTVGGTLDFDRMGISFFPRPGVVVYGVTLAISKAGRGPFESIKVCPWLLPLLRGKVRVGNLRIEQPVFRLDLAELPALGNGTEPEPSQSLEKRATSLFRALASKVPDLNITLKKGRLELVDKGRMLLSVRDLDAHVVLPPRGPEVRITCRSNLWQNLSIHGHLNARDLKGGGRIELSRFQPHLLADRFMSETGITCSESSVYLRADIRTDGLRKFYGEAKASIPRMTLRRKKKESVLKVANAGITFSIEGDKTSLSLDHTVSTEKMAVSRKANSPTTSPLANRSCMSTSRYLNSSCDRK